MCTDTRQTSFDYGFSTCNILAAVTLRSLKNKDINQYLDFIYHVYVMSHAAAAVGRSTRRPLRQSERSREVTSGGRQTKRREQDRGSNGRKQRIKSPAGSNVGGRTEITVLQDDPSRPGQQRSPTGQR